MRLSSEPGHRCIHPVGPAFSHYICGYRGRQECRASGVGGTAGANDAHVYPIAEDAIEGELVEGAEGEAQVAESLPMPYQPTQSEKDDHELTHANYRTWCEHCVNGKGLEIKHSLAEQ